MLDLQTARVETSQESFVHEQHEKQKNNSGVVADMIVNSRTQFHGGLPDVVPNHMDHIAIFSFHDEGFHHVEHGNHAGRHHEQIFQNFNSRTHADVTLLIDSSNAPPDGFQVGGVGASEMYFSAGGEQQEERDPMQSRIAELEAKMAQMAQMEEQLAMRERQLAMREQAIGNND